MKLIKQVTVYAPEKLGVKDILMDSSKIIAIEDHITIDSNAIGIEVIDGQGKIATPGFIDSHFHLLGGGGENGF